MKILQRISIIILYILFSQVYPFAHLHIQEQQEEFKLRMSVHPPDFPFNKNNHHHQSDEHGHEDTHFDGDWDHTFQLKTFNSEITKQLYVNFEILDVEQKIQIYQPLNLPQKIPRHYLPLTIPDRAPPDLS
jgi:hypothetical protein